MAHFWKYTAYALVCTCLVACGNDEDTTGASGGSDGLTSAPPAVEQPPYEAQPIKKEPSELVLCDTDSDQLLFLNARTRPGDALVAPISFLREGELFFSNILSLARPKATVLFGQKKVNSSELVFAEFDLANASALPLTFLHLATTLDPKAKELANKHKFLQRQLVPFGLSENGQDLLVSDGQLYRSYSLNLQQQDFTVAVDPKLNFRPRWHKQQKTILWDSYDTRRKVVRQSLTEFLADGSVRTQALPYAEDRSKAWQLAAHPLTENLLVWLEWNPDGQAILRLWDRSSPQGVNKSWALAQRESDRFSPQVQIWSEDSEAWHLLVAAQDSLRFLRIRKSDYQFTQESSFAFPDRVRTALENMSRHEESGFWPIPELQQSKLEQALYLTLPVGAGTGLFAFRFVTESGFSRLGTPYSCSAISVQVDE